MTNQINKSDDLKSEIKSVLKAEFDNSIVQNCSEQDKQKMSSISEGYSEYVSTKITESVENASRSKKLEMLYNHEKHFLDILKDYKEEIKFASSVQADIRKERSAFFASTLKEVCLSLKETQVDPKCQVQWIMDLVSSYTSSLDLSSKLAEEHVISTLGDIQEEIIKTTIKD